MASFPYFGLPSLKCSVWKYNIYTCGKYWQWPVVPLSILVDTPTASVSIPYITLLSSDLIHTIFRNRDLWPGGRHHWYSNLSKVLVEGWRQHPTSFLLLRGKNYWQTMLYYFKCVSHYPYKYQATATDSFVSVISLLLAAALWHHQIYSSVQWNYKSCSYLYTFS